MDADFKPIYEHKRGDKDDRRDTSNPMGGGPPRPPHPMSGDSPTNSPSLQSPHFHSIVFKDTSSPQMLYSPARSSAYDAITKEITSPLSSPRPSGMQRMVTSPVPMASPMGSPQRGRTISSPNPQRERSNSLFGAPRERSNSLFGAPRERPNSLLGAPRERSNSIFGIQRERSNSVFKDKSSSEMTKFGLQRRCELEQFLQNRGFSPEELDSIVNQFHEIREHLEGGEWVTREEFKNFFGVREQSFSDQLFDVFKQKHKMHNFQDLDFCPSPQMSREKPVGDDGIEMDAINLREFLCGLLLLQSNDVDKKLRMVFDLYNNGSEITKANLKEMLLMSAKENKITLSDDHFDTLVEHIFNKMDTTGTGTITFEDFKTGFQVSPVSLDGGSSQSLATDNLVNSCFPTLRPLEKDQKFPIELEQRPQHTPLNEFLAINTASPTSPMKPFSWTINVDNTAEEGADEIGTQHPDFVEREYDEDDPRREQHKQKNFENRVKGNYFPQQEPMPKKKANANRKLRTKIYSSGTKYLFLALFSLINIGFFAWQFVEYATNPAVIGNLGWGVPFARGFAQVLKIDTVLLLIPVSRSVLTYLRASPVHRWVPLDKNMSFHKLLAGMVVLASLGHWGAHLANFYYISNASLSQLQELNPAYFTSVPSYIALNFLTIPGLTGYVMLLALLLMFLFATKRVRKTAFETFYITHHLFIIFYAALVLHGASHILGPYEYWKWFIGPAAIYVIERCFRLYKQTRNVKVLEAKILPDRALMLKMEIPSRRFRYKAGQYIFLNFPTISKFEWHPFTLTSAPHEEFISLHIRAAGNWTKKVYDLCEESLQGDPNFTLNVDGPYGSASEHVFSYKHAIMIGAGIGVTPFASVLKRLQHRIETDPKSMKLEKVHFFWTCREQGAFQWFADILSQLEAHKDAKDFLEINTFLTGALAQHDIRSILLWYGLQQEYAARNVDLVTGLSSRTYWGRPNYERIIEFLFQQYPKERVGVFFCGPPAMAHSLRAHCKKHASLNGSTFYFHKENF